MKKLIFFLLAMGLVSLSFAHGGTPEERAKKRVDHMTQNLNLDDVQQEKIYQILLDESKEMQSLHKELDADKGQFHVKRKAVHQKYRSQVDELLTKEQLMKKQELHAQRKAMHNGQGKGHGHHKGGQQKGMHRGKGKGKGKMHARISTEERAVRATAKLDQIVSLTPDQKTAVTALNKEKFEAMKSLHEGGKGDPKKMQAERKTLQKDYQKQLNKVLDRKQEKKLKAFKDEKECKKGEKCHHGAMKK